MDFLVKLLDKLITHFKPSMTTPSENETWKNRNTRKQMTWIILPELGDYDARLTQRLFLRIASLLTEKLY